MDTESDQAVIFSGPLYLVFSLKQIATAGVMENRWLHNAVRDALLTISCVKGCEGVFQFYFLRMLQDVV